ncbi:MAG: VanZ family protein [Methylococcaceae bacterium]
MNRSLFFATVLYSLFIVYGSLVPLELNDLPVETAISQFKNIRFLHLGAESRADWIANILLYIPLAFGASATFGSMQHPLIRLLLSVCVLVSCIALAVVVEFSQLFFPPRTVSLNDLIAESLGSVIGVLSWQFFGDYFSNLYRQLLRGSLRSAQAAIFFYLLIYSALSLFPFDFVTSITELNTKLANGNDAFFFSLESCSAEPVRCGVKLLAEMLVLLPLGVLFCYVPYLQHRIVVAALVGFFLGLAIESIQVFLLSGSGQGISIITRMIGMSAGAGLFIRAKHYPLEDLTGLLRRAVWLTILPYIALVLSINGWFSSAWLTPEQALEKLTTTRFLPLYYFYYTTESVALVSLLSNIGMYFPVGLLCWTHFFSRNYKRDRPAPHWFYVGLLAALFSLIVETGKLFLADKHADPSDIWLAFMAAAGCYIFMNYLLQWLKREKTPAKLMVEPPAQVPTPASEKSIVSALPAYKVDKRWRILSLLIVAIILTALFNYPLAAVGLGLFLISYATLLAYFPYLWLVVVPALLPLMDFAPWTGRFFFDEFDLVILTTLAFYYWQKPKDHLRSLLSMPTLLLLTVFIVLYGVSLLKGLLPLHEMNANAFNNYYSHFNSLRVGKGLIWSLLLLPLLQLTARRYRYTSHYFGLGVLLGLTGVALFAIIERLVFAGLFDFSSDYRINALFSTLHVGGGHIEAYLMLSLPFITLLFVNSTHNLLKSLSGITLFIAALYTLLMTFSRGGYIGFVFGFVVLLFALLVCFRKHLSFTKQPLLILMLLVISLLMALPVLRGDMIQHRFSVMDKDRDSRIYHWHDALTMRDDDITTLLFGMGLGSYPRTFFWLNTENTHPGTYEIANQNGNHYLRLRGGDSLFMGQYLTIEPHTLYRLILDIRGETDKLALSTSLCEKSLQYSLRCSTVGTRTNGSDWQHVEQVINSNDVGERVAGRLLKRPIQLTFYNSNGTGKLLDVDNVKLLDATGSNVLANGDFSEGSDFWFFTTDNHQSGNIDNLWLHVFFDQGLLGVSAFFLLFANAIYTLCRQLKRQNVFAAVLLSSFTSFMVVGFVNSPFDAPRLTLLFFLLLFFALMRTPRVWTTI